MVDITTVSLLAPSDWGIIAGAFALALAVSLLVVWATRKYLEQYAKRTATKLDDIIVSLLKGPVVFLVVAYAVIWLTATIAAGSPGQASPSLLDTLSLSYVFILILFGTWTAAKLFIVLAHRYVLKQALKTQTNVDDRLAGFFATTGKILILMVGIAIALGLLWMAIGLLRIASGLT